MLRQTIIGSVCAALARVAPAQSPAAEPAPAPAPDVVRFATDDGPLDLRVVGGPAARRFLDPFPDEGGPLLDVRDALDRRLFGPFRVRDLVGEAGCDAFGRAYAWARLSPALVEGLRRLHALAPFSRVLSGYRDMRHQRAVGHLPRSYHSSGLAADVAFDEHVWEPGVASRLAAAVASAFGAAVRVGVKNQALHIDVGHRHPGAVWAESGCGGCRRPDAGRFCRARCALSRMRALLHPDGSVETDAGGE